MAKAPVTNEHLQKPSLEEDVSNENSCEVDFAKEGIKEPAKHDHSKLSSDKKSQHGKETLKAQAVQEIGEQHADPKESRHQSRIAEENEPIVKDSVQHVVDEDNGFSSQGILIGENNDQVPCTLNKLSDSKSTPLETDVPEAIFQQFTKPRNILTSQL
ncbi:uncharacterized protein LOC124454434 [Xenia sp. Carnegie-2017]|uniref:uncharacterized protein LOC124454434 n=1 Tax=Xenia sp. Carnegie-2017 TaxID=2897299 RepID=UPI001F040EAB|nr:uncharacterized protein LOC124454434 [Xenia sp. Carnegie-2017]